MKKVCFFIPTIDAGGIETYLLRFIRFTEGKMKITVVVRSRNQHGELLSEYNTTGVKVVFMPLGYFSVSGMLNYYRFFKANKFDSICDFTGNFAGLTVLIAAFSKIKNRVVFYRSGSNHYRKSYVNELYNFLSNRLVLLFATTILANSRAGINFFFPKQNDKMNDRFRVIRNGVDIASLAPNVDKKSVLRQLRVDSDAFVIVHSGRLDKSKNHVTMLKVAKEVISKNPMVFFVFCGKNTEKLQQEVDNLEIAKNIRLLGYRNDIPDFLNAADLFFFPSITEGQPNALIEAMCVGLPFVASDIEPIKECVPEEFHNQLVEPTDVNKNFELIIQTLNKKNDLNKIKEKARLRFDAFVNFEKFANVINN
jgi:glycosyltransferase involved in cell wall biosynthesis